VPEGDDRSTSTLTWWGHASVELCADGTRIVTDPLLRRWIGPLHSVGHRPWPVALGTVDAVLLSHLHRDHTDLPSLRRFDARTRVIVPVGAGRVVRASARGPVEELPIGASTRVGTVRVEATEALHDGRRHPVGAPAPAVGYLVAASRSVYFAGDTDFFDAMAGVARGLPQGLDLALLPVSGWGLTLGAGHMDVEAAVRAVALLRPRIAVPIHWGTLRIPVLWRLRRAHTDEAPHRFARLVAHDVPDTAVVIPVPGRRVDLPPRGDAPTTRRRP
jgi:L-ascorbate metabolism protein UlaG (beta-lactamase superfamily)